jgi:Mg-chelatase subunit ChlD
LPTVVEEQALPEPGEFARFSLLAHAIAGRRTPVLSGRSGRTYTDGESIFLVELPGSWLTASVVIQASLLPAGSLEPGVMARLTGHRQLRLRYLTLEAVRATELLRTVVPARVVLDLRALYDGPVPSSALQSLRWAKDVRRRVPEAPEWLGTVKPIRVMRTLGGHAGAPTEEDRVDDRVVASMRGLDDEDESERSRILELFSAPIRNPLASAVQNFFGMGRVPGAGRAGAELPVGGSTHAPLGPNAAHARGPVPLGHAVASAPVGRAYPEWDYRRQRYKTDWCSVAEFDPPSSGDGHRPAPTATEDKRLRRELAKLGLAHEHHRAQPDGDVIDLTALVEFVVDRATGHAGEPRVYEATRRTAHDLGVLVLLDATGSTGESTEGRTVFDEQRVIAARLTAALDELGNRVASYAFYSRGRSAVRFLRIKDFGDRYDHAAQRRLGSVSPGGYTRLGAAIRHATHVLAERAGTSMQLLVLIGDGLPYDEGYGDRYAQEDSRRALEEAVAGGIGSVCLSMRTATEHAVLERVWGDVPHRRLESPAELSRHVQPLFREALRGAAASRRNVGATARSGR